MVQVERLERSCHQSSGRKSTQLTAGPANPALVSGLDYAVFLYFCISVFLKVWDYTIYAKFWNHIVKNVSHVLMCILLNGVEIEMDGSYFKIESELDCLNWN